MTIRMIVFFFKEALEGLSLSTNMTAVHDGEQLMKLLTGENYDLPHVLFIDLNMPRKNGFECLAEIKGNEKLNQVPVIICSTSFDHEVVDSLYKNGAQFFIHKPVAFHELRKVIQRALMLIAEENVSQPAREQFVLAA